MDANSNPLSSLEKRFAELDSKPSTRRWLLGAGISALVHTLLFLTAAFMPLGVSSDGGRVPPAIEILIVNSREVENLEVDTRDVSDAFVEDKTNMEDLPEVTPSPSVESPDGEVNDRALAQKPTVEVPESLIVQRVPPSKQTGSSSQQADSLTGAAHSVRMIQCQRVGKNRPDYCDDLVPRNWMRSNTEPDATLQPTEWAAFDSSLNNDQDEIDIIRTEGCLNRNAGFLEAPIQSSEEYYLTGSSASVGRIAGESKGPLCD